MSPTARSAAEMAGPLAPDSRVRSRSKKAAPATRGARRSRPWPHRSADVPAAAGELGGRDQTGRSWPGGWPASSGIWGPGGWSHKPGSRGFVGGTNALPRRYVRLIVKPCTRSVQQLLPICAIISAMDLRQLNALLAVADTGSFSAAARSLHTVQSNVSTHVARLERELDAILVDRATGTLTEEGEAVAARARIMPARARRAGRRRRLAARRGRRQRPPRGHRHDGPVAGARRWWWPMQERHPKVRLVVVDATTTSLRAPARRRAASTWRWSTSRADDPELVTEPLFDEDPMLVAPLEPPARPPRSGSPSPTSPSTRSCSSRTGTGVPRPHRRAGPRPPASTLEPQAEIDGMRLLASLAFQGFGAGDPAGQRRPGLDRRRLEADPDRRARGPHRSGSPWRRRGPALGAGPGGARRAPRGRRRRGARPARHPPAAPGDRRRRTAERRTAGRPHPGEPRDRRRNPDRPGPSRRCPSHRRRCAPACPARSRPRSTDIGGRPGRVVEIDPAIKRGALTRADGDTLAEAARRRARRSACPLVVVHGLERRRRRPRASTPWSAGAARPASSCAARASCPIVLVVTGPAVSGPALLLGLADVVIMTPEAYAFVSGPRMVTAFTGVPDLDRRPRRRRAPTPGASGVAALIATDVDDARELVAVLLAHLPVAQRRGAARGWPPTTPSTGPPPRPGRSCPASRHGQLRRAGAWPGPSSTTASCSSCGRRGPPTWSPRSPPSAAARSASWPTSPRRWPAPSTSPPRRRAPASWRFCDAFNVPLLTLVDTPGLLPGQGPGVAGHDPPRRPAGLRLRPGHRAPDQPHPAQVLRRGLHRHGLQDHGQRPGPGLADAPRSR